jgi:hypothetical protein
MEQASLHFHIAARPSDKRIDDEEGQSRGHDNAGCRPISPWWSICFTDATVSARHRHLQMVEMQEMEQLSENEAMDESMTIDSYLHALFGCLQSCTDVLNEIVERNVNHSRDCTVVSQ